MMISMLLTYSNINFIAFKFYATLLAREALKLLNYDADKDKNAAKQ
jgi:hypothetical protein